MHRAGLAGHGSPGRGDPRRSVAARRPRLAEIIDHYAKLVSALPEPPILVGHSFGWLIVQVLIDRGLGTCGVAIDSAPPKGVVVFEPSGFRSLEPGPGRPTFRRRVYPSSMCRSIRPLRVSEPPTTDGDVRAAALQYVRKVSGSRAAPRRDPDAFEAAIDEVAAATSRLLTAMGAPPIQGEATPPALWPRSGRSRGRITLPAQETSA